MQKDFSNQDLRGKSFKNQDLTCADFSNADIRGVNFKGAILKGTNFRNAKGGLVEHSLALNLLIILILLFIADMLLILSGLLIAAVFTKILKLSDASTDANIIFSTLLYTIMHVSISINLIIDGKYNIKKVISNIALTVAIPWALTLVGCGFQILAFAGFSAIPAIIVLFIVALLLGVLVGVGVGLVALFGAGFVAVAVAIVGNGIRMLAVAGTLAIVISAVLPLVGDGANAAIIYFIMACFIAYKTSKEDPQFEIFRKIGLFLSSSFGTNFDGADLTEADFDKSDMKYCRFGKETIVMRTCFKETENLKFAHLTGTILENKAVRELLVTGNGKNQSYAGMNLKGAYLVGADLSGADFTEANLSDATLKNANMRDANLNRLQALGVEFQSADFTGACIESWKIDSTSQLDRAKTEYVYLLADKLERRPASGNFGQGEFAKLFNEAA